MPDTTLRTPAGEVEAYLALPAGEGPWPGVVVLHELLGLNADIRSQADRFAARGYVALAPDLFSFRRPKAVCVLAAFRALARRSGPAFDAIEAARAALAVRADATGRVGVIGFCMGGAFALLAAPSGGFAASSVNYGVPPRDAREVLRGACPVVGSYGVEHDVKEYPGAGHSLLNRHRGRVVAEAADAVDQFGHAPSAPDAFRRIDAFFDRHVAGRDPG